jgi:hypothetical protein
VEDRRLWQVIGEPELENVADPRLDHRPGDLTVEAPGFGGHAWGELPIGLSSLEVDLDDRPIGEWNRGVKRLRVRSERVTRELMSHRSMPMGVRFLSVVVMMV